MRRSVAATSGSVAWKQNAVRCRVLTAVDAGVRAGGSEMHDGDRESGRESASEGHTTESRPRQRSSPEDDPARLSRQWMRLSSVGLEFAAAVLLLGGIGYWIDAARQHETPYLGAAGALLGFVVGMYRLIRVAQEVGGR